MVCSSTTKMFIFLLVSQFGHFATHRLMQADFDRILEASNASSAMPSLRALSEIQFKLFSMNVLGTGFVRLPGPPTQAAEFMKYMQSFIPKTTPKPDEVSIFAFQEDVCILSEGSYPPETLPDHHKQFRPFSFLKNMMENEGFQGGFLAVHDGMPAPNTDVVLKDVSGSPRLSALLGSDVSLFDRPELDPRTQQEVPNQRKSRPNIQKLCNTIYFKLGSNVQLYKERFGWNFMPSISTFVFKELVNERNPEYANARRKLGWTEHKHELHKVFSLLPNRAAVSLQIIDTSIGGKVIFEARNTHLSGGKFDDGFALLQPGLNPANSPGALQLDKFASEMRGMARVLCGDTNQRHSLLMNAGLYDLALRDYYFDFQSHFGRMPQNPINKEKTGMSVLTNMMKDVVLKEGAKVGIKEGDALLDVYAKAEQTAKDMQHARQRQDAWKNSMLVQRGKALWTLPGSLPGGLIPKMPKLRQGQQRSQQNSCLPGAVIDHIFFDPRCQVESVNLWEDLKIMDPRQFDPPTGKFGGISVTDHYPVFSRFRVGNPAEPATQAIQQKVRHRQAARHGQVAIKA